MSRLEHVLRVGAAMRDVDTNPEATDGFFSSMKEKVQNVFKEGNVKLGKEFVKHVWWMLYEEDNGMADKAKEHAGHARKVWDEMSVVLRQKELNGKDLLVPTYEESEFLARYLLLEDPYPELNRSKQTPARLDSIGDHFWKVTRGWPYGEVIGRTVVINFWWHHVALETNNADDAKIYETRLRMLHKMARKKFDAKNTHEEFSFDDMMERAKRIVLKKPVEFKMWTPNVNEKYPLVIGGMWFGENFFDRWKMRKESLVDKARNFMGVGDQVERVEEAADGNVA